MGVSRALCGGWSSFLTVVTGAEGLSALLRDTDRCPHPDCDVSPPCFQQVVEGSAGQAGAESGPDFAGSPVGKPPETESWWSGEQRCEAWGAAWA